MEYSFVIPCYRSERTLEGVVRELIAEAEKEKLGEYEIILVNDDSPDGVWGVIKRLCQEYPFIHGLCLARNFGQHAALLAGYARAKGGVVVSLDDDGQAPLDELYKLLGALDEETDAAYASYREPQQNWFRRFGSDFASMSFRLLMGTPKHKKGSSFFAVKKYIIDEIIRYDNAYPSVGGLVRRSTNRIEYVDTNHRKRAAGRSGYSLHKLFSLWLNGVTTFSVKPLELGVWLGLITAMLGFLGGIVTMVRKICHPGIVAGWTSTICVVLLIGGIILLMLGLLGEYIGRIYICINKAPQYVIREETCEKEEIGV